MQITHHLFPIVHSSDIAAARRAGMQLAATLSFDETVAGRLAIVITEAATNILKHAGSGRLALNAIAGDEPAVEVLALDQGPGIRDLAQSLRDGVSTAGTAGNGLGAMRRQSDQFDAYAPSGKGSAFYMRIARAAEAAQDDRPERHEPLQFGGLCFPIPGEEACGDAWAVESDGASRVFLVADGLGHGPEAARAAQAAVQALRGRAQLPPARLIELAHGLLRPTRGAALAVAAVTPGDGGIVFAGIGNIVACVVKDGVAKHVMSHNGIVGHNMRKVQEFRIELPPGALFVMHSDGMSRHWDLAAYPGLAQHHPLLAAGVLYRDFSRGRDDVTVLAIRHRRRTDQ